MNTMLIAAVAAGTIYLASRKKSPRKKQEPVAVEPMTIAYRNGCEWVIREGWLLKSGRDALRIAIEFAKKSGQDVASINTTEVARDLISTVTPQACLDSIPHQGDIYTPLGTWTRDQALMASLVAHVAQRLQSGLDQYIETRGTVLEIPTATST